MDERCAVEVWRVPTPLPRPVMTVVGPYDTYFHVVVLVTHPDGTEGWGYSGMATEAAMDATLAETVKLLLVGSRTLTSMIEIENFEPSPADTAACIAQHAACNAIALAAWDTTGRRLLVPCAELWGRRPDTDSLPVYYSGFFLDATDDDLRAEARRARDAGFRLVKTRVGRDPQDDLARYEIVRETFPEPGTVAVDAVNAWTPAQAGAFAAAVSTPLLWLEDATPYDRLGALRDCPQTLAAGESLQTVGQLRELAATSRLDAALLDVQMLGGPIRFLATARALAAEGVRIGAHVYTAYSAHLLACVDDPLPVESFDWSDALLREPPMPDASGRLAVRGPGFGLPLDRAALEHHGVQVVALA